MIYTVTCNPALDYLITTDHFQMGKTNRTKREMILAGGKGINVSMMLHNLGVESVALGFIAGFTGDEIKRQVEEYGCKSRFLSLATGCSRINLKLLDCEGTEINGQGPAISNQDLAKFMSQLEDLKEGDTLVLSGSIPASLPSTLYQIICEKMQKKKVKTVVDATRDLLMNVLPYHPFLIKPNHMELGDIFDVQLQTRQDVIPYAEKLQELGARNVLVSLAGEGAVLISEECKVYSIPAPIGKLVNGVGAGDSMVAGFLAGYLETQDYEKAFMMSIASGSASAYNESLASKTEVNKLLENLH